MEMLNVRQRVGKSGKVTYQASIRIAGKVPIYKTFNDLSEARRFSLIVQRNSKSHLNPSKPLGQNEALTLLMNEKLVDAMTHFMASDEIKQRHKNIFPTIVRQVGEVRIGEICRSWVKRFIKHMRAEVSDRTHRTYTDQTIAILIQTMSKVVHWRADDLDLKEAPKCRLTVSGLPGQWTVKRARRLEPSEEILLMKRLRAIHASNKHESHAYQWRLLIRLALETGARMQELTLANWEEFNLPDRFWTIPSAHEKRGLTRVVPLTAKAHRIVRLLRLISEPGDRRVFHALGTSTPSVSSCFHRYSRQAGLLDFRFHDLRHEAISRMVLHWRQYNLYELMTITGHSDSKTFKRYANLRGADLAGRMM